jgi:hypothetical protein
MTTTAHSLLSCFLPSKDGQRVCTLFGPSYSQNSATKGPRIPKPIATPQTSAPWTQLFATPALGPPTGRLAPSCLAPCAGPSPRAHRMHTGYTPDTHRRYTGCTSVDPVCIRCTPGVQRLGAALGPLWASGATFAFRLNTSRTGVFRIHGVHVSVCQRFTDKGYTLSEPGCFKGATPKGARIHCCTGSP